MTPNKDVDKTNGKASDASLRKYDVGYMQRTRDFYSAQGYSNHYQWAKNSNAPFTTLRKPLKDCRVAVITTAMPDTEQGRTRRGIYPRPSRPYPDSMFTSELSWHKSATHTDDTGSFLPLRALDEAAGEGIIGELCERFYTVPTDYSKRNTSEVDAPHLLNLCREDAVDIVLLVPL